MMHFIGNQYGSTSFIHDKIDMSAIIEVLGQFTTYN